MKILIILVFILFTSASLRASEAVILLYHHVSQSTPPSTSVTPEVFREHLDFLEDEGFRVLPLVEMLDALYAGKELPARAVAITFDDAYQSIFENAWPELQRRGLPFTLFIATDPVDRATRGYMNWDQLRQMDAELVDFGAHSVSHGHLLHRAASESLNEWEARVLAELTIGAERIHDELNQSVRSFAYPFGEYNADLSALVAEQNWYGLAQQSGAVASHVPPTEIPRFPMATGFADINRFRTAVMSRALPVEVRDTRSRLVEEGQVPRTFDFQIGEGSFRLAQLACYSSSGQPLTLAVVEDRVEVQLPALTSGRNKINCTAPSSAEAGRFYWYSQQWILADRQGRWLLF